MAKNKSIVGWRPWTPESEKGDPEPVSAEIRGMPGPFRAYFQARREALSVQCVMALDLTSSDMVNLSQAATEGAKQSIAMGLLMESPQAIAAGVDMTYDPQLIRRTLKECMRNVENYTATHFETGAVTQVTSGEQFADYDEDDWAIEAYNEILSISGLTKRDPKSSTPPGDPVEDEAGNSDAPSYGSTTGGAVETKPETPSGTKAEALPLPCPAKIPRMESAEFTQTGPVQDPTVWTTAKPVDASNTATG